MNPFLTISRIENYSRDFENLCNSDSLVKISYIRKRKGKWVILSEKGKVLGTYNTKEDAVKRLKQIEWFKHHKKKSRKKKASEENSYSSIMRKLNKSYDEETVKKFQKEYKKLFDQAYISGKENDDAILEEALKCISMEDDMLAIKKLGSAIDMGDPAFAGKYLADLLKFLLRRISVANRDKAIFNLKKKIYYLNEYDMASKKTPPSSSIGQSITLIKTILLEHSPEYIRNVLNSIVRNL
jgi:hypothetical protein